MALGAAGEVLPSPASPMALGTDDAFCKDQTQLGWDDMGDPAVSAYLPEHRGCSMKLDVVAGAVWCRSGDFIVEAAPNGVVARVAGDRMLNPCPWTRRRPCAALLITKNSSRSASRTECGAGRGRMMAGRQSSAVRWTSPALL